jgi:hypothetical protein
VVGVLLLVSSVLGALSANSGHNWQRCPPVNPVHLSAPDLE